MQRINVPFAVAGDSAGGGLALAAAIAAANEGTAARAGALFSPWVDLTLTAHSLNQLAARDPIGNLTSLSAMRDAYVPTGMDLHDPRLSPLFDDLADLPPMLIQVGSDEGLLDDSLAVDRAVRAAGGQATLEMWPEMIHIWHLRTEGLPQAKQALERAGAFLKERLTS